MSDSTNPKDLLGIKKPRLSLVSPIGNLYEALAMQDGAGKYGPYNWRSGKKIQLMIYVDACKRHLDSFVDGEELTRDSKVPNLGAAKACIGIIIDALETGNLLDDRPPKGAMADLIEKWTKKDPK